jgi:hypothetical protein
VPKSHNFHTFAHQELQDTEFGTEEMSSSMNTSEMPTDFEFNFISSASSTSSIACGRKVQELTQDLGNKTHEETQMWDSNVSEKSSWDGNACGGMSKQTLIASGTSASGELKKFSLLSLGTQGKHKRSV